jgi:SAM-dependent methyltransferase/uncharacterized protein YbaR (Trm112 family)
VPFEIKSVEPDFGHFCRFWCAAKSLTIEGPAPAGRIGIHPPAARLAFTKPAAIDREDCRLCHRQDVAQGALVCGACRRVFPLMETIPELLPPELRNEEREREFFDRFRDQMGMELREILNSAAAATGPSAGDERKYQKAEMGLTRRPDLPFGFFGPGLVVPFEPLHPIRSIEKILRFMISVYHGNLRLGDYVLDLGVGYAWTTEWLKKLGYNVIGVDLNRDYPRVGLERTGGRLPPILIADVENLPVRRGLFHGILFFDSFHHIADRESCLRTCAEALMPGGLLMLAEPGSKHESHPASVHVMKTYGILEKGITERELKKMIRDTAFEDVKKFPYDFGEVELLLLKKKGTRVFTSKGPNILNARIEPHLRGGDPRAGEPYALTLSVRNTGDTLWLHKTVDGIGEVRIGVQLKSAERVLLNENYHRIALPRDVAPGESVELETVLPPVADPGDYLLEIDGVSEGIIWFKDLAYNPVVVNLKVRP